MKAPKRPKGYAGPWWTPAEDALFVKLWTENVPVEDMVKHFPGRTVSGLRTHRERMPDLPTRKPLPPARSRWSDAELKTLKDAWLRGFSMKEIVKLLPRFSATQIQRRRALLGLPVRKAAGETRAIQISAYVTETVYRQIRRRCEERRQTEADYLRMLIARDVG